ncbi:hypothetical protein B4U37_01690 [Sutcliffiella horikoshii]|uniref:Uncharacterized protein n=1 Tax=Sutcliffiella horikoshii TaxID=79883 RepID=A0ABM6KED1_9BACI|nr:hypothetical protein [Sutcliffiella horikoshii]ART74837.1 hypothetical protein B4U37_01690 [Sutcliffiella horikoshii]
MKINKVPLKKDYVQIPNSTALAVEKNISLQALGLIVNLWSYNVEKWDLHKTEVYKRFEKNKKTSVSNAWDELVEANFIIEFKYRKGRVWEYEYYYRIQPFSEEEKKDLLEESARHLKVPSTSDFQELKMSSTKGTVQKQQIINNRPIEELNNEKQIKDKLDLNLNPEEKEGKGNLFSNVLQNLKIPDGVKRLLYDYNIQGYGDDKVIANYRSFDVFELEIFYNTSSYVKENVKSDDLFFINQHEFTQIVQSILKKGPEKIDTTFGILRDYTLRKLSYKEENFKYNNVADNNFSEPNTGQPPWFSLLP